MACILVADDDKTIRSRLRQMLERHGYDVVEAGNGNEVLQVLEVREVDLLVLDIVMPEKDGLETLIELGRRRIEVPVIAMSGSTSAPMDFLKMARKFGAREILYKPFKEAELIVHVANTLMQDEKRRPAS